MKMFVSLYYHECKKIDSFHIQNDIIFLKVKLHYPTKFKMKTFDASLRYLYYK